MLNLLLLLFFFSSLQVVSEASLTVDGFLPEDGSGVVVGLQDLAELESACFATAGGDVVLFNLNTCQVSSVLCFSTYLSKRRSNVSKDF